MLTSVEKIIFLTVISIFLPLTAIAQSHQPDSVKVHRLDEVVVESSYITREDDHILAVPTKEQRRQAVSGYDLFLMKNRLEDDIITAVYSVNRTNWNRRNNQYATIKVVYSFDYGRKTSKSPEYQHTVSESAILCRGSRVAQRKCKLASLVAPTCSDPYWLYAG